MPKLELWQTTRKIFSKKFSNQQLGASELSQLLPPHQPIKWSFVSSTIIVYLLKPCNGLLKLEDRAKMPQEPWKLMPSQWRSHVMVWALKIYENGKNREVSLPVRSSPIVLITCLPYIQSPTEIPKPPNNRIDGGVLPTWDTWPSVHINQIAISGPIALETSLPPCVKAPKHAVKIFLGRSFLLKYWDMQWKQNVYCKVSVAIIVWDKMNYPVKMKIQFYSIRSSQLHLQPFDFPRP